MRSDIDRPVSGHRRSPSFAGDGAIGLSHGWNGWWCHNLQDLFSSLCPSGRASLHLVNTVGDL
jgi:hypothetical protein